MASAISIPRRLPLLVVADNVLLPGSSMRIPVRNMKKYVYQSLYIRSFKSTKDRYTVHYNYTMSMYDIINISLLLLFQLYVFIPYCQ
jgi:hypothetical protein